MEFQLTEPVLLIGIGGVGSKLAIKAKEELKADCLLISNDSQDFTSDDTSIEISTGSVVNPSVQLIRGCASKTQNQLENQISNYSSIVLMANLAGKAGAAIAPVVSSIAKQNDKKLLSFAVMPFKFEKERIFQSGISLKRLRDDSNSTIVLDNDALLDSNPDLTPKQCHEISNAAIYKVISSLNTSILSDQTSILSTSKDGELEDSFKDALKMLYQDAPPNAVKRSMLYVYGGDNTPVGVLNSVSSIANQMFGEDTNVELTTKQDTNSNVVMLSSIQGETRFEKYDPLSMISKENTLDWDEPECSIDCKLDLYQLE